MTEKHAYAASVRRKGLENTGVTEDIAKRMYNTLERRTLAIVEVEHRRQVNDADNGRSVELVITAFEPSSDENLDEHLRQLMRTLHQNRVLNSDDQQLQIETGADVEPSVDAVIAAQRAHAAEQPHDFDPGEDGEDGGTCWCSEAFEADVHAVAGSIPLEPADENGTTDETDEENPA